MNRALPLALAAFAVLSCTSTAPQIKYIVPAPIVVTASAPWSGQTLFIDDTNGDITVQGDPAVTTISVSFTPFAYAANTTDGDHAVADVMSTATLTEGDFGYLAQCEIAAQDHGSALAAATGCDIMVSVPLGTAAMGMPLSVTTRAGNINLTSLVASTTSLVTVYAADGTINADGITGSLSAHADSGTVTASVTPIAGSVIAVSSDNGNVTLDLPNDFSATVLSVTTANQGTLSITGFDDAITGGALDPTPAKIAQATRMGGGPVAADILVFANYGTASLVSQ